MIRKLIVAYLLVMTAATQIHPAIAAESLMTLYPVADNYADSKYAGSEADMLGRYGKGTTLYVGNSYDRAQDIWGSERIYIRFDLSSLVNRVVVQAKLVLWQFYAPKSNQTYEAYRVLQDWDETTQNWENQPASSPTKTSVAIAPNWTEVRVEWDITNDVKAWYTGEIPNYGTMIKVANETRVSDSSSGFWSREYTVGAHEEWRPRLEVLVDGEPTFVYNAAISVAGLPAGLPANLVVDGGFYKSLSIGDEVRITFDEGTSHTIAVSGVLMGKPGVRYVCDINQTRATDATRQVFVYATEYLVNITSEPGNVFETPQSSWYRSGMSVPVVRTSNDTIRITEGERLVFDAWYLDGTRMGAEPTTLIVDRPTSLVAKYEIEYYLSIASSFGVTNGSGWYKKDTVASFSVDRNAIPAAGILGSLGLKKSFQMWVGSQDFVGVPSEAHGSIVMRRFSAITAVWQDEWDPLVIYVLAGLAIVTIIGLLSLDSRRKKRRGINLGLER